MTINFSLLYIIFRSKYKLDENEEIDAMSSDIIFSNNETSNDVYEVNETLLADTSIIPMSTDAVHFSSSTPLKKPITTSYYLKCFYWSFLLMLILIELDIKKS